MKPNSKEDGLGQVVRTLAKLLVNWEGRVCREASEKWEKKSRPTLFNHLKRANGTAARELLCFLALQREMKIGEMNLALQRKMKGN